MQDRKRARRIFPGQQGRMWIRVDCDVRLVETSIGISATSHLIPMLDHVDLDGHLLLADDPFEGIGGQKGRLTLTDRPGLGLVEKNRA